MKPLKDYWNTEGKDLTQKTFDTSKRYISQSQDAAREWLRITQGKTSEYRKTVPHAMLNRFLTGLKIIIPLGLILFVLIWFLGKVDNILQPLWIQFLGRKIPGLGLISGIIVIIIIGILVSTLLGRKMVKITERIILRIPVVRSVYLGIQQIIDSFSSKEQGKFLHVVLIEFPREGMRSIGFVTNEFTGESGEPLLNVFIPTAPNPTSGFLQIVKKQDVVPTNMSVDDAFKMVMSAGKLSVPFTDTNIKKE
jgi:uncharacterized membrane protein